jgi:predicted RNase H-like nuclease (RuvC/YqgF family)
MFEPTNNTLGSNSVYKIIEELEQEKRWLHEEKLNLLDVEAHLQARINSEVENRKHENAGLRLEIEQIKQRCEVLTRFLNKQILAQTA